MELINFRHSDNTERSSLIEKVCENLALPDSTFLGTRITKKMLVDNNELSSHDKKLVTDVIQSIEWQNTLKPETLNVPVYVTETVEYIEIAVIRVVLKSDIKNKTKLKNVAKLLHSLIPYPVILLLELDEELAISLADKRINQADKSKLVIEHIYNSDWLSSTGLTENENNFLNDFSLKNVSSLNYFELYQDFISMLIGLETSKISGHYLSKSSLYKNNLGKNLLTDQNDSEAESQEDVQQYDTLHSASFSESSNEDKTALLKELASLEAELSSIRNKIKKETQMNAKMRLNVEARKVKLAIHQIKEKLY
nr:methyl-accepting chemotaxis protein [Vibrio lentus]